MTQRLRQALVLEVQMFLLAVQFMTRLPVPQVPYSDDLAIRANKFYPAVGLVVGLIGAAVLALAHLLWPWPVAVLVSMAATLFVTGALHEDGLADSADGIGGGMDAEAALVIMRDSRIGSYGVVTLGLVLALKASALWALSPGVAVGALIGGHVLGRMACVHVIASTRYARQDSVKFAVPAVTVDGYAVALLTTLGTLAVLTAVLGLGAALCGLAGAILAGQAFRRLFLRKLGGYTGDCLGGAQQLSELGFLLGVLAWL